MRTKTLLSKELSVAQQKQLQQHKLNRDTIV